MSEVFFVQNGWIQDGRIQDGCHPQVEWEWMSEVYFVQNGWIQDGCHHQVNYIEILSVRVRVVWECFWVNLREDNKVSESKMAVSESNMEEFKMAAIIKLSQNEWMKFFFVQNGWIQDARIKDGWNHQIEWEWMSLSQVELVWVRVLCKMAESKMSEFKMAAIIKLIRLN